MALFSTYKPSISPPATDYPTLWNGAMDELDSRFGTAATFGGTLAVTGAASFSGGITNTGSLSVLHATLPSIYMNKTDATAQSWRMYATETTWRVRNETVGSDRMIYTEASGLAVTAAISATGKVSTPASVTGAASLNIPHGTAPTSPTDGDVWSTTTTLNFRLNGVTKTVTLT